MNTDNTISPDASESWYSEREARIQAERSRVDAQENLISNAYSGLENQWAELDRLENDAHDAYDRLDTREIVRIQGERQRLLGEANQLRTGYEALQSEKAQLDRAGKLDYQTLVDNSSEKSKLFLQVFRSKIEHDPAALRRLLHADSVVRSSNIPVDSNDYFAAIERHMGFKPEERRFEFENERQDEAPNQAKRERTADKVEATEAQKIMARNLPGVSEDEYLAAVAQPFSQAATVTVEPDQLDFGQNSKGIEVSFDETPKKAPARYKAPDPKTSVNLSPAEIALVENMAVQTSRPLAEVRTEFAKQKLALHAGKTSHMLYQDRLKAMGQG